MDCAKVVLHYDDGRILKGYTWDFHPDRPGLHLHPPADPGGKAVRVNLRDLKAVFFVKDFRGDGHPARPPLPVPDGCGRKVEVTFADGERLVGRSLSYHPKHQGFFVFPMDASGNNLRVFVVSKATRGTRFLQG